MGNGQCLGGWYTSGADGLDAEGDSKVGLAGAGRLEQVQHLMTADGIELCGGEDAVAVERGLEREVVALQGLDRGEPGHVPALL